MGGKKAHVPDGFTGLFFQKYWDIVGEFVMDMVKTCFRNGHVAKFHNHTNISPIPKTHIAEFVSRYRPICNFDKSGILFSKELPPYPTRYLSNILNITSRTWEKNISALPLVLISLKYKLI